MFALPKIPQNLSSPFGLLGDDAKLAFRTRPDGIVKLAETRNIPSTDEKYWSQYALLFDTASDVFSLISPHDIRRALVEAPENVATLVRVLSARLFSLVSDHTFPSQPTVVGYASSLIGARTGERNPTKEVLNCIRVLQRVLPVIFESEGGQFEAELLWKKETAPRDGSAVVEEHDESQFVIEDEDDEASTPVPKSPKPQQEQKFLPSLAERLFSCTMDLLFCCGFTLPLKIQVDHYKINYIIWEKGVGSTADVGTTRELDANKAEVLRLLLVLLSKQIYQPPSTLLTQPSAYTTYLVQSTPRRHVLTLLCSLLNTAMNSSNAAFQLPYNHLVWKGEDPRSTLVGLSLQVLCVVSDYQSAGARDGTTASGDPAPTAKTNSFRYFLAKLHRSQDFAFIFDGIMGILGQEIAAYSNLLPGSRKQIPHVVETFIFLWKMIELNKKFRAFLLEGDKSVNVVAYLLCFCLELKDKPQHHGLCRALTYIVQSISAEAAFGSKLSSPIKVQLPSKWVTGGAAGDFMITSIYSIVATTSGTFNSLYPALIISLSNVSPYLKNLTITASTRLFQLFTAFTNPSFLLSDEGHPRLVFFMLEVFNNIIYHQLSENPNVIYAILRSHKFFEDLGTFTLSRGLREVRRVQLAKEEQDRKGKGPARGSEELPHEEKARLLDRESGRVVDEEMAVGLGLETGQVEEPEGRSSPDARGTISRTSEEQPRPGISEKARGKMKERSASTDTTASLERLAATGVGRNGFVPTQEWVTSWHQGLPLDPIMLVISELLPKVQELQASLSRPSTSPKVIEFLRSATLRDVLPSAPPLNPRRFQWSDASMVWLTSLIWGEIYVRAMTPLGVWNATNVRLFYVKHAQPPPRQITDAVTNVVGGFLGRGGAETAGGRPRASR